MKMKKYAKLGIMLVVLVTLLLTSVNIGYAPWTKGGSSGSTAGIGPTVKFVYVEGVVTEDGKKVPRTGVFPESALKGFDFVGTPKTTPITRKQYNYFNNRRPDSAKMIGSQLSLTYKKGARTVNLDGAGKIVLDERTIGGKKFVKEWQPDTRRPGTGRYVSKWGDDEVPDGVEPDSKGRLIWERENVFGVDVNYYMKEIDGKWHAFSDSDEATKGDVNDASYTIWEVLRGSEPTGIVAITDAGETPEEAGVNYRSSDGEIDIRLSAAEYTNLRGTMDKKRNIPEASLPAYVRALEAAGMNLRTANIDPDGTVYDGDTLAESNNRVESSPAGVTHTNSPEGFNPDGTPLNTMDYTTNTVDRTTGQLSSSQYDEHSRTVWDRANNRLTVIDLSVVEGGIGRETQFAVGRFQDVDAYIHNDAAGNPNYWRATDGSGREWYRDADGETVEGTPPDSLIPEHTRTGLDEGIANERNQDGLRSEDNIWLWNNILGGKFMDKLGEFFRNDYRGFGGYFSFFYEEKWMKQWRDNVHRTMCDTLVITGGIDCWTSKLCHTAPERSGEDIIFVPSPTGGLMPGAYIAVERSESPMRVPQENGTEKILYLYKIEYQITNSHPYIERAMHHNLIFKRDTGGEIAWYDNADPDRKIDSGSSAGARGGTAIVLYSEHIYTEACLDWTSPPVRSFTGEEYTHMCTPVKTKSGAPTMPYNEEAPGGVDPDTDGDGLPDSIDDDDDGDGVLDVDDNDSDNDGIDDDQDNCPAVANPGQEDMDGDGVGDACDVLPAGYYF